MFLLRYLLLKHLQSCWPRFLLPRKFDLFFPWKWLVQGIYCIFPRAILELGIFIGLTISTAFEKSRNFYNPWMNMVSGTKCLVEKVILAKDKFKLPKFLVGGLQIEPYNMPQLEDEYTWEECSVTRDCFSPKALHFDDSSDVQSALSSLIWIFLLSWSVHKFFMWNLWVVKSQSHCICLC